MKKITLTLLVTILFLAVTSAQSHTGKKQKTMYAELLGSGVFGSVNFDSRFSEKNSGLGFRVGLGMIPDVIVIPLEVNGLAGKKKILFEYGIGISNGIFLKDKPDKTTFPTGTTNIGFIGFAKAGIRYQPQNKGIMFNLNWTPMVNSEEIRWAWFGLGIGYSWE